MFEKFGELGSAEEINELAENLFNEQDEESLKALAKENGIPKEFVDMYLTGDIPSLCDCQTAALGKIEVEAKELKPKDIMEDWVEYLRCQIVESEELSKEVRSKEKRLKGMIGALLKWSFAHQRTIEKDILQAAGIKNTGKVTLGIPGMGQAKKIIKEYYMGEKA